MKHEQTKSLKNLIALVATTAFALIAGAGAVQAQQANIAFRGTQRDPFAKRKFSTKVVKPGPKLIEAPSVEARIQQYKERKAAAVAAQLPAPKPTTAFLLSELRVTGIFRTPRGWAAMVEADPIKLSYTIYPGETFYNGMLVAIEENRLVFRRESRWSDGRREQAVEMKPLAQPSVKDSMTAATVAANSNSAQSNNSAAPSSAAAQSLPNNSGAQFNDEAVKKMIEEMSRKLGTNGSPASIDPNSPEMKTLLEMIKNSAAKPKQ